MPGGGHAGAGGPVHVTWVPHGGATRWRHAWPISGRRSPRGVAHARAGWWGPIPRSRRGPVWRGAARGAAVWMPHGGAGTRGRGAAWVGSRGMQYSPRMSHVGRHWPWHPWEGGSSSGCMGCHPAIYRLLHLLVLEQRVVCAHVCLVLVAGSMLLAHDWRVVCEVRVTVVTVVPWHRGHGHLCPVHRPLLLIFHCSRGLARCVALLASGCTRWSCPMALITSQSAKRYRGGSQMTVQRVETSTTKQANNTQLRTRV